MGEETGKTVKKEEQKGKISEENTLTTQTHQFNWVWNIPVFRYECTTAIFIYMNPAGPIDNKFIETITNSSTKQTLFFVLINDNDK